MHSSHLYTSHPLARLDTYPTYLTSWFAYEPSCFVDCFLTPGDHSERAERTPGTQVGVLMVAQVRFT